MEVVALLEQKRRREPGSIAFYALLRRDDNEEREQRREAFKPVERREKEEGPGMNAMRLQLMGDQELAREMTLYVAASVELSKYTILGGAGSMQTNMWRMQGVSWNAAELQWRVYQNYNNSLSIASVSAEEKAAADTA